MAVPAHRAQKVNTVMQVLQELNFYFMNLKSSILNKHQLFFIQCENCPEGTYRTTRGGAGLASCTKCAAGTFSNDLGRSTVCVDCETGKYSDEGATESFISFSCS